MMQIGDDEIAVISISLADSVHLRDLTSAEVAVVEQLLMGASNEEIAQSRGTSIRTVANQVASVFRKLRISSRAELLASVMEKRFQAIANPKASSLSATVEVV
jgi:DNA-binding NarL/FixJ family response regulator